MNVISTAATVRCL